MWNIRKYLHSFARMFFWVFVLGLFVAANLFLVPFVQYSVYRGKSSGNILPDTVRVSERELSQMKQKAEMLKRKLHRLTFAGDAFLIVNTTNNTFRLYQNRQVVRSGLCSTGSFIHLEADSLQSWLFETPKGVFTIKNKMTDPVWRKPDWAFIEEGLPPPPPGHPSRYERGVLGDYALDLGKGYLIHGTLYQRLIGQPVTHGCIRLNDQDLEHIYKTLQVGSKVYIY